MAKAKEKKWPSAYHALKAGPCNVAACRRKQCEGCAFATVREHAARDLNELKRLKAELARIQDSAEAVAEEMRREAEAAEQNGESVDASWVGGWADVLIGRCGK